MLATAPALMSTPEFILLSACVGAMALVVLLVDQQVAVGPQARPLWQACIAHCFLDKPDRRSAVLFKVGLGATGIRCIGDGQSVCRPADIGARCALRS